jgi:hypothetical protein
VRTGGQTVVAVGADAVVIFAGLFHWIDVYDRPELVTGDEVSGSSSLVGSLFCRDLQGNIG